MSPTIFRLLEETRRGNAYSVIRGGRELISYPGCNNFFRPYQMFKMLQADEKYHQQMMKEAGY